MTNVPNHVALIVDGNRRWADEHKLSSRSEGHVKGMEALRVVIDALRKRGVSIATAWVFSTENWKRSSEEVGKLMSLFRRYLKEESPRFIKERMRYRVLGDKSRFDAELRAMMDELEEKTKDFDGFTFNMAVNYGGRDELVRAVKKIIADGRKPEEIDKELISSYLDTAGQPDPDLIIRTSGECRLSGFMPWQQEYAEFYFAPWHFPDFDEEKVDLVLADYAKRDRRKGK